MRNRRLPIFLPVILVCVSAAFALAETESDPTAERFYSGNALYNRKLYSLAVVEYKLFVQKHPQHQKVAEAKYGIALSYYSDGKYKEAEPYLKELLAAGKTGDIHQLALLRGFCLLKLGNFAEAEKMFARVADSREPTTLKLDGTAGLAEALFQQKKWNELITRSDKLRIADTKQRYAKRTLYHGVVARHQLKKYAEAIPLLIQLVELVKKGPLEHETAYLLAECYRETGKIEDAAQAYAAALAGFKGAQAAEIYYRIGFIRFLQKKYDEAIAAFDNSLKGSGAKSKFADQARIFLGRSWLEKGDFNRAITYLGPHSGTNPAPPHSPRRRLWTPLTAHAEAALWLGRVYSRQKQYAYASTVLGEAITKFPTDQLMPDFLYEHANALIVQRKYGQAAKSLASLLPRDDWPNRNEVLRMHAVCLHHAKSFEASLKATDEFLANYPKDKLLGEVRFVRAENLYLLSKLPEAIAAYREFLAEHPKHKNINIATFRIAQAQHIQKKWKEAHTTALPLVAAQPKGKAFNQLRFLLGDCEFRTEQWAPAVSNLTVFVSSFTKPVHKTIPGVRGRIIALQTTEPNVDVALIQTALANIRLAKVPAAAKALDDLRYSFPESVHIPLALAERGRIHYEAKQYPSARAMFEQFIASHPKAPQRPQVEYYFGWTCLAEKKNGEAEQHFGTLTHKYQSDPLAEDAILQLGLVQLKMKKYVPASQTFRTLAQRYPKHQRMDLAIFSRGVAYARAKNWRAAAPDLKLVAETYPKSEVADKAFYEWAWAAKALKKSDAVKIYEKLIAGYPDSELCTKARTELAELTFDAADYDKVIADLKKTLEAIKDPALKEQTTYRLGTAYFNKKDYENSAATFGGFVKTFGGFNRDRTPKSKLLYSAYFQLGESKMQLKEMIDAQNAFAAAVKTGDATLKESALLRLGETQALNQQWPYSAQSYSQFLQLYPASKWAVRARFGLAWAYEKQAQYPQAMVEYRKIVALNKKDEISARSQFQIGECLFASKKYDEALQQLVRVEVKYGYKDWAAKASLEMGRVLEGKGDKKAALAQFKEVLRKYSADPNIVSVAKQRINALRQELR